MRHAFTLLAALLLAATAAAAPEPPTPTDVLAQLPDFPSHWNQAHLYNQVIRDEYGNSAPAGCVPVAGAACMDWFDFPAAFGALAFPGVKRELRTETLDWARLAPTPLDARGRRTAQTILYNLGLYGQIYYVSGGSSTMPLQYLAAVLTSKEVGYASAYFVEFGSNATDAEVKTTIWASLRCGSPVAMSISRDGGAHAVVATGCGTDESGAPLTQVFGGYGSAPTWMDVPTQMPVPGGYTYNKLASVVTGIVPKRPEGVDSGLALPVLGTVKDREGKPVPFAKVTLSIGGKVVAETATDLQGRYGLWGWFGHDMTVSCGETNQTIPAQTFPGSFDWDTNNLLGTGNWEVSASALAAAIERVTVNFALPAVERPTIYTSLENAKAEATAKGLKILCLSDEVPDLKAAFRSVTGAVLLYADPRLDAPFPEEDSIPDATAFVLDATGKVLGYSTSESMSTSDWNTLVKEPSIPSVNTAGTALDWNDSFSGKDVNVRGTKDVTATVTGDIRLGTLTVGAPLIVTGEGTLTWASLVHNASLTLDGPNLRYVVPKKDGESSYFSKSVTVQNGAELYFGVGDVSGYGYTEAKDKAITIGQGGILCVVSRDTLTRRLILDGGHIDLGNRDTSGGYGFGSFDLLHTIVEVKGDSSVAALSGVGNAALCIRGTASKPVTEFQFTNGARLDCPVLVAKPKQDNDQGTLQLSGDGVAAFGTVEVPTKVSGGVLLEGGTFSGGLSLTDGTRLSALHPITVTGALTVSGTVTIDEPRSGVFLRGNATTTIATSAFTAPSGFTVKKVGNDYRLVATSVTEPVWYADGVRVEAKPGDAAPENSLLVLTTTDRKESGLWEGYAAFRSSPAGGGWNVCVAADGNIPEGTSASGYIQSAGCGYVLIGASASEIPALAGTTDRLAGLHVGRLPLRESISMGTVEDLGSLGNDAKQTYVERSDAELIEAYVAKLVQAGDTHARGKLSLLGGGYGVQDQYNNDTDFTQWDGLPSIEDAEAWTKSTACGLTVYALRDRYRLFKTAEPAVFPDLTLYDDVTIPRGTAPNGLAYGRGIIGKTDGALLWVEDRGRRKRLSTICVNGTGNGTVTAEAIPGLYALAVTPSGQSGDFSQADSPSVGEMLVLNPQGGALSVLAPTGTDATLTIFDTGIPSSATHTVCAAVAEALIETPSLTVGQAFSQALTANPDASTTLTLLGDPTVRVMAWPEPKPLLPEGEEDVKLAEETLNTLRAAAEAGGLFKDYEVTVTGLDGAARPVAELDDALACFEGLEPTVEGDKVVVAYDFGITGLRVENGEVVVTLAVRGKEGQTLTFAEDNAYAIAPQSLDGTQILAEPPAVTPSTPTADGTVELRFTLPEASDTFLFRARVSPR